MLSQRRWPRGSPVGGRYAPRYRPVGEASLDDYGDHWSAQDGVYDAYVEAQHEAGYQDYLERQRAFTARRTRTVELADLLLAEAEYVEFPDHSAGARDGDWATLSDMRDGDRAGNNCWAATSAVVKHIVEQIGTDPDQDVLSCELVYDSGVHWAPVVRYDTGHEMVVDFTARQFDPEADFPLIAPLDEWKSWVDSQVEVQFGEAASELNLS